MSPPASLMPLPTHLAWGEGVLTVGTGTVRWMDLTTPRLEAAVARLPDLPLQVRCARVSAAVPALGDDESYRLRVDAQGVHLEAGEEWGVLRGCATLQQLLGEGQTLAHVDIADTPRFGWRGLLLDVARHFMSVGAVERTLDAMAFYKLNVLHLHLTDDQGFRFESLAYPELARLGGEGDYFTQAELRGLVEVAANLGIRIVPEIDVPGHCTSWLAAHPEWGAGKVGVAPSTKFGVHEACLDVSDPAVGAALETLLAEIAEVFPDRYLHIGGDEVNPVWWRARGIEDPAQTQATFNADLARRLQTVDRVLVGWDEVLHDDLPEGAIIQCWRGGQSRDRALAAGFDCVFSAPYYLDLFYPADVHYRFDPGATSAQLAEAENGMRRDPRLAHVGAGLDWATDFAGRAEPVASADQPGEILGGEACLWTELVSEPILDVRLWSRLPAVAERLWSAPSGKMQKTGQVDSTDMYRRLMATQAILVQVTDVDLQPAWHLLGLGEDDVRALAPLFEALEPAKWYARLLGPVALAARLAGREAPTERPYDTHSPLDRVADVLPPESFAARAFAGEVDAFLAHGNGAALLRSAGRWREQARVFPEIVARTVKLEALAGRSRQLAAFADIVERAVAGRLEPADFAVLKAASPPEAELVFAVLPALQKLLGPGPGDG